MNFKISAWLLSISAAMLFLAACTSPNDAGKEVLPGEDQINSVYVDTFDIEFSTIKVDSVRTQDLSMNLIGNYVDEEFGWIFAETYIQPRLTGSNLIFGNDPSKLTLDSIVLSLDLLEFYGKYDTPMPLEIFEITEDFPTDSTLNSNSVLGVDSSYDYANGSMIDFSGESGFFDFIELRLDDSLGRKLLFADPSDLVNNTVFTSFFKGLLIRSAAVSQTNSRESGGIFTIDPRSSKTKLTLYYKDSTAAKTVVIDINDNSKRYHRIRRTDYSNRLISSIFSNSGFSAPYGALEAGAIVQLYVGIPALSDLPPVVINQAKLVMYVDPDFLGSEERYEPPKGLALFIADTNKVDFWDYSTINNSASYNDVDHSYTITLTNTIQQMLAGTIPNNGFLIIPLENGVTLNRAVIAGPGHPTLKPVLKMIYTTLPQ